MPKKKQTPEELKYKKRVRHYKNAYGISIETYNKLLKSQKYRLSLIHI